MENVHEVSIEIPDHVNLLWLGCFPGHQQRLAPCCAQKSNHRPARQSLKRSALDVASYRDGGAQR